jgi:hypothetical protein
MARAAADWSAVADVRFVYRAEHDIRCTPDNPSVLFDVRPVPHAALASAFFPSFPRVRRTLRIDDLSFAGWYPLEGILRHELGHALGFRHEHLRPEAGFAPDCDNIHGGLRELTEYDRSSVMHYPQCNGDPRSTLELTPLDAAGAAAIYGAPADSTETSDGEPSPPTSGSDDPTDAGGVVDRHCQTLSGHVEARATDWYASTVPADFAVSFQTAGTGNADLVVYLAEALLCASLGPSADETCALRLPSVADVFVGVHGSAASSYELTACWDHP